MEEWRILTDPGFVRARVFERDHGVCAICHQDAVAGQFGRNGSARSSKARGTGDVWQADHIVPVVEGGGECSLDNYRTLCTACHLQVTAALKTRLAARRKAAALAPLAGPLVLGDAGQIAALRHLRRRRAIRPGGSGNSSPDTGTGDLLRCGQDCG